MKTYLITRINLKSFVENMINLERNCYFISIFLYLRSRIYFCVRITSVEYRWSVWIVFFFVLFENAPRIITIHYEYKTNLYHHKYYHLHLSTYTFIAASQNKKYPEIHKKKSVRTWTDFNVMIIIIIVSGVNTTFFFLLILF